MSAKGGRPPRPSAMTERGRAGATSTGTPTRSDLRAPAGMPPEAVQLWNEVVPQLAAIHVFESVDRAAMKAMCLQWSRIEKARKVLATEGLFARGSMGQIVEHPALAIEAKASALFLRFAEQFGLTASARARLDLEGKLPGAGGAGMAGAIGESPRLRAIQGGQG